MRATRGARNVNLQAVIKHASHVCSQHSFGLPLRMKGLHKTLRSRAFGPSTPRTPLRDARAHLSKRLPRLGSLALASRFACRSRVVPLYPPSKELPQARTVLLILLQDPYSVSIVHGFSAIECLALHRVPRHLLFTWIQMLTTETTPSCIQCCL